MKTKEKKLVAWRKRKNAPVICEDTHSNLTSNTAVRGTLTIKDRKSDTEWDNDSTKWKYE